MNVHGSKAVWIVPILALGVALFEMPYGYYQLLRVLVFCVAAYLAYRSNGQKHHAWAWTLAGVAILYNPIFKMHLGADVWPIANAITIGVFAAHMWHSLRNSSESVRE